LTLGHKNVGKTEMTINIRDGKMWNLETLTLLGNNKNLYLYKNWKARAQGEEKEKDRRLERGNFGLESC
jgi:hypothetical protein